MKDIPSYIKKLSPEEAYIPGYDAGIKKGRYDKLIKVEDENMVPSFMFLHKPIKK